MSDVPRGTAVEPGASGGGTVAVPVAFEYVTGLSRRPFSAATLVGNWTVDGRAGDGAWSETPMTAGEGPDGSVAFRAEVEFAADQVGTTFSWGVELTRSDGSSAWGIPAEVAELEGTDQVRRFLLGAPDDGEQREQFVLTRHRWYGARPRADGLHFTVWAPHALEVSVHHGGANGYIADDGTGEDPGLAPVPLTAGPDGVWSAVVPADEAGERGYMYRVVRDDGRVTWDTDMWSREQIGSGDVDPRGRPYDGPVEQLDGTPSCSLVVDPSTVSGYPDVGRPPESEADFWADEFDPAHPVPRRLSDLVIYELHIGALAPETTAAGTLADALALLPYLEDLGVTAVELLPLFEFNGSKSWGYGSSHFLAIESSAGGRDALRHFVRACHRRGIAVLMDVVYNHYNDDSQRAAWQYDSAAPERNSYYWYEGDPGQYRSPDGGYVDNVSSGYAPRYWEDHVRDLFVSSAALLVDEFHLDGLRVDQTTSIHSYNSLHDDGRALPAANVWGRKFLRQLCQTMKLIDPDVLLIAEDHSGWPAVTEPAATGGVGFDARWYVDFYHHLIGDKGEGSDYAKLLDTAARGDGPLAMARFAAALEACSARTVVYVENHDEAGNSANSRRTILAAVDGAPLVGATRAVAEARCRFAAAMSFLSPGIPLFLMGEEVGAQQGYTYDRFTEQKEDLTGLRLGTGAGLFRCHQDLIAFRRATSAVRTGAFEVLHCDDGARLIAFLRGAGADEVLVVGSLATTPHDRPGYTIRHPDLAGGGWQEVLNTDAGQYGGNGVGNGGATLRAEDGGLDIVVPASGAVVFRRVP
jgi:1,4-alpha-glucan branching enzyme